MGRDLAPVASSHPDAAATATVPMRMPARSAQPARRAGQIVERCVLATVDIATVAVVTTLAGAGWRTAAAWSVSLVLVLAGAGTYRPRLRYSVLDQAGRALLGLGLLLAASVIAPLPAWLTPAGFSLAGFALRPPAWLALAAAALLVNHAGTHRCLYRWRRRAGGVSTVVLGTGEVGLLLAAALRTDRSLGLAPVGLVGRVPLVGRDLPAPILGGVRDLDAVIKDFRPGAIVVAFAGTPDEELVGTLRRCRRAGIAVYVVPRLFELPVGGTRAELVNGVPLVRLRPEPGGRWRSAVKRGIDIAGAAVALMLLSPVLALCALAARCEVGRAGVVFRQQRIGLSGKPFTIMKFRSLSPTSTVESDVKWSIASDTRVGPVGRFLRASSLDELPQLVNVLRGDMSLVGPRPERPYFVDQFQRTYAGYGDRHRVPVGITGWAQIHGLRGDTSIEDRVRFDNFYVENWSLRMDMKIMLRTVGSMISLRRR
jgi:exopolysaccharide biosynthesis polyprenyl glycosylphosphotransferase